MNSIKKAYYHLPGLFEFYELYEAFLPIYREHREYFYDWCGIGSIYGAPADCIWGGGRIGSGEHGFAADFTKLKYSYNVGLWGTSICGGEILDSAQGLPESAYLKQVTKEGSEQLRLTFEKGELKAVNDEKFDDPIKAIQKVEEIGAPYGIGRDMHVGDTIIGIKGRVGFEAAAPMLIIGAHRFLEKYTLSKWQQYWKDQVANWYGMFLHESQYLEPVMRDIEAMLQESQRNVNGTAILELRPLSFSTVGVESKDDLVKTKFGEYGEMQKGWTAEDAKGFIKVTSTPLRVYYNNHKDEEI